ncbi:MAG TPA: L-threonylcarbamoyladenylate synthase [Bacteroidales bacterium]|nr:L-threonylcarbamoyladenylate synthase [Bacteroidales bacterium]
MEQDIQKAAEILRKGGIILYPTDTIWGIGCDATNVEAVKKVYQLKQREEHKCMLVLVDHIDRIGRYVKEIPDLAIQLIEVNDLPMTIIYPGAVNLASNLISPDGTIGIRVVNDDFCQKLIRKLNKPIVSSSANISGQASPAFFNEVSDEIKNAVDYIVEWHQNDTTKHTPSQIIKVGLNGEVEILRK